MEVKSRQILDVLAELGLGAGKTHSSSLESDEADKVRAHFERGTRSAGHASGAAGRTQQTIAPKIDLSHISKPGDVLKAILAKKKEDEEAARHPHVQAKAATTPVAPPMAPVAKTTVVSAPPTPPAPRKIVPQPRTAPQIIPPSTTPAIASRPPSGPVVAKAPAGAAVTRPVVVVAPPPGTVVLKPPAVAPREDQQRGAEKPAAMPTLR